MASLCIDSGQRYLSGRYVGNTCIRSGLRLANLGSVRWLRQPQYRGRRRRGRARPRCTTDPVLLGVAVYTTVVGIYFASGWGGIRAQSIWMWVLQIRLDVALFVLCRRVARLPGMLPPARRFWNAFGIGGLFFTAGDISQTVIAPGLPPLVAVLPGMGHEASLGHGLAFRYRPCSPSAPSDSRREQIRFWLDAGTVMTAAMVFAWYFSVSPGRGRPQRDQPAHL